MGSVLIESYSTSGRGRANRGPSVSEQDGLPKFPPVVWDVVACGLEKCPRFHPLTLLDVLDFACIARLATRRREEIHVYFDSLLPSNPTLGQPLVHVMGEICRDGLPLVAS
jgi:hypothetical protein